MKIQHCHYTNLGLSMQPKCADSEGFLKYRNNFQTKISENKWTASEKLIDSMEKSIKQFNNRNI